MKLGIISDSHDSYRNVLKAVDIFNQQKVDYVLHAGDIVSAATAKAFAGVEGAKFIAVFGNCDIDGTALEHAARDSNGEIHAGFYLGEIGGKTVFMTHRPITVDEQKAIGKYDVVIYGHTHKRDVRKIGQTLLINPGESRDIGTTDSGVMVLDMSDMSVEEFAL